MRLLTAEQVSEILVLGHYAAFTLSTYAHTFPGLQEEATQMAVEQRLGQSRSG